METTFVETTIAVFVCYFLNRFLKKSRVPVLFEKVVKSSINWLIENTTDGCFWNEVKHTKFMRQRLMLVKFLAFKFTSTVLFLANYRCFSLRCTLQMYKSKLVPFGIKQSYHLQQNSLTHIKIEKLKLTLDRTTLSARCNTPLESS